MDDGFALTKQVKVKSVVIKVKVVLIHVVFKASLVSAYSHGRPNRFIVIKASTGITTRF